jgi:hypothetical protein
LPVSAEPASLACNAMLCARHGAATEDSKTASVARTHMKYPPDFVASAN